MEIDELIKELQEEDMKDKRMKELIDKIKCSEKDTSNKFLYLIFIFLLYTNNKSDIVTNIYLGGD